MARPTKARSKPKAATKTVANKGCLPDAYSGVEALLNKYVPPFKVGDFAVKGKESLQLVTPKPVVVPGAYGEKPHHPLRRLLSDGRLFESGAEEEAVTGIAEDVEGKIVLSPENAQSAARKSHRDGSQRVRGDL
jgi:hypothetical protein